MRRIASENARWEINALADQIQYPCWRKRLIYLWKKRTKKLYQTSPGSSVISLWPWIRPVHWSPVAHVLSRISSNYTDLIVMNSRVTTTPKANLSMDKQSTLPGIYPMKKLHDELRVKTKQVHVSPFFCYLYFLLSITPESVKRCFSEQRGEAISAQSSYLRFCLWFHQTLRIRLRSDKTSRNCDRSRWSLYSRGQAHTVCIH